MSSMPPVHLCIVQPAGYVHALGFVDQARYFRFQFRRAGAVVTMAKNRLRHDALNLVFGAHLGFDATQRQRYTCLFVNLEQLGEGGAAVSSDYLSLLHDSAVVDYDAANVPAYAVDPDDVPVVSLLHAPYLQRTPGLPLAERPIDLLFFGSMNERRQRLIAAVEAQGLQVSMFDSPLYGEERDAYIRQAKAVLNCHFYESSRFEQARISHVLSLGTPVISERTASTRPHPEFEDSVFWVNQSNLAEFIRTQFGKPAYYAEAERQLKAFAQTDPIDAYVSLLAFGCGYRQVHSKSVPSQPWQPSRINLGSGKDYKSGWLNLDVIESALPDLLLDLGQPQEFPLLAQSERCGPVLLAPDSLDEIYANNVLEHVPDLPRLMTNCLALLKPGGRLVIEVPYELARTAWQDPTHLRALNENSWLYYTDWFWYLGWFEHRFEIAAFAWLNPQLCPCDKPQAAFMRLALRKVSTSPRERTGARAMQANFGGIPEDLPPPVSMAPSAPAEEIRVLAEAQP